MSIQGILHSLILSLTLIVPVVISAAFFTLAERKVMAAIQRRKGPQRCWCLGGLLQPIADGLKLVTKEFIVPSKAKTLLLALTGWAVIPFSFGVVLLDIYSGVLYIFAVSSLGIYGVILSGWASNSKYAFLGALRASAQMSSYEVSIGLAL
jgi:NADH-quinone oxidoreductase subunit H